MLQRGSNKHAVLLQLRLTPLPVNDFRASRPILSSSPAEQDPPVNLLFRDLDSRSMSQWGDTYSCYLGLSGIGNLGGSRLFLQRPLGVWTMSRRSLTLRACR